MASTVLRFSRCCRSAKGATLPSRMHQQLAVDARPRSPARPERRGRSARCRRRCGCRAAATPPSLHRLHADAVPLPLGGVVGGVEPGEVDRLVDGLGQHHRPEAARMLGGGPLASGPPARRTGPRRAGAGRARPPRSRRLDRRPCRPPPAWPAAPRGRRAGRRSSASAAPSAPVGVEQASSQPSISRCTSARRGGAQRVDHLRQLRLAVGAGPRAARPGPRSRPGRRHSRRTSRNSCGSIRASTALRIMAGLAASKVRSPVSAASAQPRSGIGRLAQIVAHQASAWRCATRVSDSRSSRSAKARIGLVNTSGVGPAIPTRGRAERLEAGAPAVLPGDAQEVVIVTGARRDPAAGVELHRIAPVHRERQRRPDTPVALLILLIDAIDLSCGRR